MNTTAPDTEAVWDNVWDDKKEAIYNRDHRQKSVRHWQVDLCRVGTTYYAKDKYGGDIKSCKTETKKNSHAFCRSVMEAI